MENSYEYIQRIPTHYVGNDCIQIMTPNMQNGITVLNSDGMTYHYMPSSKLFVNKYLEDKRAKQFPYSNVPNHKRIFRGKIYEYINQLLDFNRVYIEIADNMIKQYYVVKDGDEALLVTKQILPDKKLPRMMCREKVKKLFESANGGAYTVDGGKWLELLLPSNDRILELYKKELIKTRQTEQSYSADTDDNLTNFFHSSIDKMTIDDVPEGFTLFDNCILVYVEENEIKSIKGVDIRFMYADKFSVEFYDFPITIYSLEDVKQLEQTNSINISEPRFPRFLNSKINRKEIKKEKEHILSLKQRKR